LSRGQDIGAYVQHSATKLPPQHISGFYWIANTGLAIVNAECGKLFTYLEFRRGNTEPEKASGLLMIY
jgi:hypothetical protein